MQVTRNERDYWRSLVGFLKVAPQVFQHTDGYAVQVGSRTTMEYIEGSRKAIIDVEFGRGTTCIYVRRIVGWISGSQRLAMTDDEKRIAVDRISAALQFDDSSVEISAD